MAIEFDRRGFRFASQTSEAAFRDTFRSGAPKGRRLLVAIAVAYTVASPLLGPWLTGSHVADYKPLTWLLLGLVTPVMAAGLLTTWTQRFYPYSSITMLIVALTGMAYSAQLHVIMSSAGQASPVAQVALIPLAYGILGRGRVPAVVTAVVLTAVVGGLCAAHTDIAESHRDLILFYALCGLTLAAGASVELTARRAWEARERLAWSAHYDELTGIYNRRALEDQSERVLRLAAREQCDLCVLAVDLDHFKRINDTYGHLVGDEVIRCVGEELRLACRRPLDLPARLGGEEFLLVYFNVSESDAANLANEIHKRIGGLVIPSDHDDVTVTASIGGVTGIPTAETTMRDFIARADRLLYVAKHAGRDRVAMGRLTDAPDALYRFGDATS